MQGQRFLRPLAKQLMSLSLTSLTRDNSACLPRQVVGLLRNGWKWSEIPWKRKHDGNWLFASGFSQREATAGGMRQQEEQGMALSVSEQMLEMVLLKSDIVALSGGGNTLRLQWRAPIWPLG